MKKNIFVRLLVIVAVFASFTMASFAAETNQSIDISDVDSGLVHLSNFDNPQKKVKVMIKHNDSKYFYDVVDDELSLPLQMGNGSYAVVVYEQVSGNKYKAVQSKKFTAKMDKNQVFLNSIQSIEFNENDPAILKAKELTKNASTDMEKFMLIHEYVVSNVQYDYSKARTVQTGYIPSVQETFVTNTGICYDYASLMASMLRSIDVPTKLVKGYRADSNVYHAWNEVYVDGEWKVIDATYDASLSNSSKSFELFKSSSMYLAEKVY